MSTTTSRRSLLAGAATLPALAVPAVAQPSPLTAHLERLVAGYYEASARWAPLMLAAHAKANAVRDWSNQSESETQKHLETLSAACDENGCDAAAAVISEFHEEIEDEIEDDVLDAPTRTIDDLWAKALITIFRSAPVGAGDDFTWEREHEMLVRAVAEIAGRSAFLEGILASVEGAQS